MILLATAVALQAAQAGVVVCVVDAATGAPLVGAAVQADTAAGAPSRVLRDACGAIVTGSANRADHARATVRVSRAGYATLSLVVPAGADTVVARLVARATGAAMGAQPLPPQQITATRDGLDEAALGTAAVRQSVADARARGAGTTAALLTLLPFTQLRSARGETGLSLRGARREQVVVTLDGLPLNDPATGVADVSDVPLASLGSATVAPGANPLGAGLGATGGVLALSTRANTLLSTRAAAFGQRQVEGATTGLMGRARWHGAASWRTARNDFAFVNEAGAHPVRERRVNNDETVSSMHAGVLYGPTQWVLLASQTERGMVGPANVRTYDADRARTSRLSARVQHAAGATMGSAGLRQFSLHYTDPTRPSLNSSARAWAADMDWRGAVGMGTWRVGLGGDGLTATGGIAQQRTRAFASYGLRRLLGGRGELEAGARADAVERHGVQPTASFGGSWALGSWRGVRINTVGRVAQAVRVPTLYDLYFSNPQRLSVRALEPERVTLDGAAGVHLHRAGSASTRVDGDVLFVRRRTRQAIIWFPGNFGWSPANVGEESLHGVEARLAGARGPWQADAWLTHYNAVLYTNGLRMPTPYVPTQAAGVRAQHTSRVAQLSVNSRYQGRRPYTAGPRNPFFELPAVWLVDGAVSHHRLVHRTDVLVTLAIDNATNARWQSVRGFPMPGRSWSLGVTVEPAGR